MSELLRILKDSWYLVLSILVLLAILFYVKTTTDTSVRWDPLPNPISVPPVTSSLPQRLPVLLEKYSAVWRMPLFTADRVPDAVSQKKASASPAPSFGNVKLTGVVLGGETRVAMLTGPGNLSGSYREGQSLPNGWVVTKIEERKIELGYGQTKQMLELAMLRLPLTVQ